MCRRIFSIVLIMMLFSSACHAQGNINRLSVSFGALYERGLDVTLSYEHEGRYHHSWEYFLNGYIQYAEDPAAGHITKDSFWHNVRTWSGGVAYKPCVVRGRNHHGNARVGASVGSDCHQVIGLAHVGYEHSLALKHGFELFLQVKEDVVFHADDHFRTGIAAGLKVPL